MRELIYFSTPIIASRLIQTTGMIVGNILVAWVSADALAASALATSVSIAFFTFASGVIMAMGPRFSRCDEKKIRTNDELGNGFVMASLLGIVIIFIFCFIHYFLKWSGQNSVLTEKLQDYFYLLAIGVLPMLWTTVIQQYALSRHLEKTVFQYCVIRLFIGIGFNSLFIFGLPSIFLSGLGFIGLGLGVSVSSWLGFVILLVWINHQTPVNLPDFLMPWKWCWEKITKGHIKKIIGLCGICIPAGLQISMETGVLMIITLMIGTFGHNALGAWQIVSQYVLFFTMIPFGVSQAIVMLTSEHIKSGQAKKNTRLSLEGTAIVFIPLIIVGGLYLFFPEELAHLYLWRHEKIDSSQLALLVSFFGIMFLYQLFDGVRLVSVGLLRGHLKNLAVFIISLFTFGGITLVASGILGFIAPLSAKGVVLGLLVGMITATLTTGWWQIKTIKASTRGNYGERM